MMPVYFAHPQVLIDAYMVRLAAFPIHGPLRHYAAFRAALQYHLADLVKDALECGEDVAGLAETRLNVPAPAFAYNDLDAREAWRLLALPRANSGLTAKDRAGMELALNAYALGLADAILDSDPSQAFLTDISTHFASLDAGALEQHFVLSQQVVHAGHERQNDRAGAEILQAQALAAEHYADLTLEKYLESLLAYADR